MCLAMCFDTGMLIRMLFGLLVLGVICGTPLVIGVVAFANWLGARRKRMAANLR